MKLFVILLCKLIGFVGGLFGKGTSLPGKVALRICPDILSYLTLPESIIAVTGSNGKTSTVEMIAHILLSDGKKVIYNKEGSNQIEGVASLLIKNCSLSGKVRGDTVLLETDERYARFTFRYIKPTHFVITNLCRDQLTRNAHPFYVFRYIKEAVELLSDTVLILNADDPIIRSLGESGENTLYFGMDKNRYSSESCEAVYNDCHYCPKCKNELSYEFFHYAHQGKYSCSACGFSRPETDFTVNDMDLEKNEIQINRNRIELAFSGRYNIYNLCAAFSAAAISSVDEKKISEALSDFVMKNGRVVKFTAGKNDGMLITSKHENSTSYNQSLEYVARQKESSTVVIIVDEISRKYFTGETSWLWDISFGMLNGSNVKKIILAGKYCYDLALRFEFSGIESAEIITEPDLDRMAEMISAPDAGKIFAITCFSDKDKLYSRVDVKSPVAK